MEVFTCLATSPLWGLPLGEVQLMVHSQADCFEGVACCIHHPSSHHMVDWPLVWRGDRRVMARVCRHNILHPDPDDLNADTFHRCDGCCRPYPGGGGDHDQAQTSPPPQR